MTALRNKLLNNPVIVTAVLQTAALLLLPVHISGPIIALLEVVKRQLVTPNRKVLISTENTEDIAYGN